MNKTAMLAGTLFLVCVTAVVAAQSKDDAKRPTDGAAAAAAETSRSEDEAAIRQMADTFTKAYKAGDAKGLAALFVAGGELINETGMCVQGREEIERLFTEVFQAHPHAEVTVSIQSIRFLTPSLAVEEGVSKAVYETDEPAELNRYTVVHVKQEGHWLMASVRDLSDAMTTASEELRPLEWLVGDWVDEGPDAVVATSYRWAENHDFILCDFHVLISGRVAMTGTQRIGWDPLAKQLRSWIFDSEGGFTEGMWTRDRNQWIVRTVGVTRDGQPASATNITTRLSRDRMTWQSRDRIVGGKTMPNIAEVSIARKARQPQTLSDAGHPSSEEVQ
ncbi:MAG: YybH family protein [Pirellulaceae bacterium]